MSDSVALGLGQGLHARTFWQVLPNQPIRIFIGASLTRMMRRSEVETDTGRLLDFEKLDATLVERAGRTIARLLRPSFRKGTLHLRLQPSELLRDRRNVELLALLRDEPRLGVSELARRVGMSAPAVRERILRLEDAGIIRGCRLELDAAALGYPVAAYIRVRPAPVSCGRWSHWRNPCCKSLNVTV